MKVGSVAVLGIVALYARPRLPHVAVLAALLAIGVFDVSPTRCYAVATTGILPLIAVAVLYAGGHGAARPLRARRRLAGDRGSSSSSRSSASD